jgi:cytochrome b subunit of formate dehydrogenase
VTSLSSLIISVTLLIFFYGIIEYILGRQNGDANKINAGNTFMTWGLVALFVMFSVYGIVRLSQGVLFNNRDVNTIDIPAFTPKK